MSALNPTIQIQGKNIVRWACAFVLSFGVSVFATVISVHAFSLGTMNVKSSFGEKFDAEVELIHETSKDIEVVLGTVEDYSRLGVQRQSIVDELYIPAPADPKLDRQIIHVISDRPLFYPSFNLVIRARQGADTLIENYLVSVDFQQSVTLRIQARKESEEQTKAEPPKELAPKSPDIEEPILPSGEDNALLTPPAESMADAGASRVAIHPTPLVVRELANVPVTDLQPRPVPQLREDERMPAAEVPSVRLPETPQVAEAPSPETTKTLVEEEAAVVAQVPSPEEEEPEPEPEEEEVKETPEEQKPPLLAYRERFGPLKKGQSLSTVVKELGVSESDSEKAAVALWMDNPDKFIQGNIHGLDSGVELNLSNFEARLPEVNSTRAHWTIQNQWQEWKVIKSRLKMASQIDLNPLVREMLIPKEKKQVKDRLMNILKEWKTTWEGGDLEAHLALFSEDEKDAPSKKRGFAYWKTFKARMFKRHKAVRIKVGPPAIVHMENRVFVGFDQGFDSNRMRSFGRKTIEFTKKGEDWKIVREQFAVKKFLNKSRALKGGSEALTESDFKIPEALNFPLVIHASTKLDQGSATEVVNVLKSKGFQAYSSPLYIGKSRKIYRVLVGRLSDWQEAESMTRIIRRQSVASFAAPKRFPYALQAGEFLDTKEAEKQAEELLNQGWSPLLFSADGGDFPSATVQVLVGGFLQKKNAEKLAGEMEKKGIKAMVVSP